MTAQGVADVVVKAVEEKTFDVIVMNFANADMVGHSGKMEPTIRPSRPSMPVSARSTRPSSAPAEP